MADPNNLNLITRLELLDTLKVLPSGSVAGQQIAALLNGTPGEEANQPDNDIFDIQFGRKAIEDIAYAVEQFSYVEAQRYAKSIEEGANRPAQDRSFQYWQALSERWGYLELMVD